MLDIRGNCISLEQDPSGLDKGDRTGKRIYIILAKVNGLVFEHRSPSFVLGHFSGQLQMRTFEQYLFVYDLICLKEEINRKLRKRFENSNAE